MVVAKAIWDQIPLRSKMRQGNAIARVVTTLLLASFFLAGNVEAQLLTVNDAESNSLTAQDLLDKLLTGSNAVGSSPMVHGAAEAIGIFDQGGSIGLTEGAFWLQAM